MNNRGIEIEYTLYWELSSSLSSGISPFLVVEKYFESCPLISAGDRGQRRRIVGAKDGLRIWWWKNFE